MDTIDPTLVPAILAGNTARFSEVVHGHEPRVRAIVARGVRDPDRLEELVQQVFAQAFRRLSELADPARLEAWLATIARNTVIEAGRRRARRARRERSLEPGDTARSETERPLWVWEEVAKLPLPLREVIELRYRLSLSYLEIAERIGVPHSTVRGRIYEARRALRKRLSEEST